MIRGWMKSSVKVQKNRAGMLLTSFYTQGRVIHRPESPGGSEAIRFPALPRCRRQCDHFNRGPKPNRRLRAAAGRMTLSTAVRKDVSNCCRAVFSLSSAASRSLMRSMYESRLWLAKLGVYLAAAVFSESAREVCISSMGLPCDGSCGGSLDRARQIR